VEILKTFNGRTQHQIKNRFIFVLSRTNSLSKEIIRREIKNKRLEKLIKFSINSLKNNNEFFKEKDLLPKSETISMFSSEEN